MAGTYQGGAVLFDLDGTLVDTAEDLAAAMNHALVRRGLAAIPSEEVRHLVGHGARRMLMRGFERAAGRPGEEAELDESLAVFLDYYADNIAVHSRFYDGVIDLIEALREEGARVAICTNKREGLARLLIDNLGVGGLFDAIVGGDTASKPKPDPAPVHLCKDRVKADRAVFVGDSDTDIKAARAAGLPCFVAAFGYGPLTMADDASACFNDYAEAAPLIEKALSSSF